MTPTKPQDNFQYEKSKSLKLQKEDNEKNFSNVKKFEPIDLNFYVETKTFTQRMKNND